VRDLTLADFPFLASLAGSDSPKDRRIWVRVASDYFVSAEPSDPAAIERFADAMAAQLDAADAADRLDLARKLAPCRRTPLSLLAKLESVEPEVGDYVLEHAVAYVSRDLVPTATSSGRRAVAVAKRKDLDQKLVRALAESNDLDVLIALAGNVAAPLDATALARLIGLGRERANDANDRRLVEALLARRPVKPEMASLFLHAKPEQRVEILLAAQRMQLARPPSGPPLNAAALDELELAAVARQPARFVAVLAEALECEPGLAQRIVDDQSGEPLAVALAALGAANEVLVRVLISNDLLAGASYQRIRALARLNNALDRSAASTVVAALRDGFVRRRHPASPTDSRGLAATLRAVSTRQVFQPADATQRILAKPRGRKPI
jgi:uncharacterized protein (DUF2336 family)